MPGTSISIPSRRIPTEVTTTTSLPANPEPALSTTPTSSLSPNASAVTPSDLRKIDRAEKTSTLYYDRIGYEDFDAYLNPNILEPVQQFMMNLRVRYTLKPN